MKITKGKLQQIIQEELKRVLTEQAEEKYVVIGNAGQGRQSVWPKSDEPQAYSKEEADAIVKDRGSSRYSTIHWHAKPLSKALDYIDRMNIAHGGVSELLANQDNDLDTNDDGRISRDEWRKEIEDIKDDLPAGGHTVTGNHEGQEFSVQVPDALARTILDAHAALLATSPTGAAEDGDDSSPEGIAFGDSVRQVYAFVDEEVAKQTGVPVHPKFGINGEYHMDGSQMSDVLNDAGNYL
jgi:hypothetical protein